MLFDAVLFDLDETLILDEPVSRQAFFATALEVTGDDTRARRLGESAEQHAKELWKELPAVAAQYALRIGHSAIEGLWATYDPRIPAEVALESAMATLRPEAWRRALQDCEAKGDPARLEWRWRTLRERYPTFVDTDVVLARLRPHVKLGIVTNGVAGLQRRKLNGSGLLPWFDAVAVSGELDIGKPERGIFEWVSGQLGVAMERCLMVGDNSGRDVLGGINAGMKTVWVDRGFKPRVAQETWRFESLAELVMIVTN